MDESNYQWPYTSMTQPRETGIDRLNAISALSAQLEVLPSKLDVLVTQRTQSVDVFCDYCAGNHPSHQCTISYGPGQYGGDYLNNYAYPDYHQDWGYHPDSTWSYNYEDQYYTPSPTYPPEFSCPPPLPQEEKPNMMDLLTKSIADQEELLRSQEISTQNLNNQMALLINSSTGSLHIRDSEPITENLSLEDCVSRFIASSEERIIEQERSIQNIESHVKTMFEVLNKNPQDTWPCDMDAYTDEVPVPNLKLDVPYDLVFEGDESCGEQENNDNEELALSPMDEELILLAPQMPSPPKFFDPARFAIPCPLGSHVIGQAFSDIKASASLEPWAVEEEKFEEESFVFDMLPDPYIITNTKKEAPTFGTFVMEKCPATCKLGDFNLLSIAIGNLPKDNLLLMDGGILYYRLGVG